MRAIFKNWSLFWAEQKEDQRSHQQVELSGKDGSSCTEGSRLSPLRLRPKSVMLATVGDKKFINLTGLSLSRETMLMKFSRTVSRGGPSIYPFLSKSKIQSDALSTRRQTETLRRKASK